MGFARAGNKSGFGPDLLGRQVNKKTKNKP